MPLRLTGARAVLQLAIQRPDGTFTRVLPAGELPPGRYDLTAPIGKRERGGRAVAFEVALGIGGSGTSDLGTVKLRRADRNAGGRPHQVALTDFGDWFPATDGSFSGGTFSYSLAGFGGYIGIRPQQPAAREPIPVLATPALARAWSAAGTWSCDCRAADRRGCGSSARSSTSRRPRPARP